MEGEDNSVWGMDGEIGRRESKRVPHRLGLVSTDFLGMLCLALWMWMVVVDGRAREIIRIFFYFSLNFSGLGSISNMARAEFDKVKAKFKARGRNSVLCSEFPDTV